MHTHLSNYVRIVLWTLPLAGLLFAIGILMRGPSIDPAAAPDRFAQAVTAANATTAWLLIFAGMNLELPGLWALYATISERRSTRAGFWGFILSLLGISLILPLIGFMALAAPTVGQLYLQGQQEVMAVAVAMTAGNTALIVSALSGLAYTVGSMLLAVVLWRQQLLPRPLAVAYALQAPLLVIAALFSVTAELAGALLLVLSSGWIAWQSWQRRLADVSAEVAAVARQS
jgi:hypothetical protein